METAERICKRLHSYLRAGAYQGRVNGIYSDRVEILTPFGMVNLLRGGSLLPFSCTISGLQPFTAMGLKQGMDASLSDIGIEVPDAAFFVDVTLAEDIELSIDVMVNLFIPVDLPIRSRYIQRVIEQYASSEDLSMLVLSQKGDHCDKLREPLRNLAEAFLEQDAALVQLASSHCSGFGSGYVPASDSLLCGYLACYAAFSYALGRSRDRVLSLTRAAALGGASNTNENGAAALLQSGEGMVSEDLFQLLRCLFSDIPYTSLGANAGKTATAAGGVSVLTGVFCCLRDQYLSKAF